ncbi:MAG: hypothetical protein M9934_10935 [Thermomicrobiales bacterium]|nr:hypothetical protein [Thermomicrobiales bacterium]
MPQSRFDELWFTSEAFPQGRLLESYYDRDVTRLSDRGLASNMIGDRWSDVCTDAIETWPESVLTLPDSQRMLVSAVHRLDAKPGIARVASKRGLQNPDFLVRGMIAGENVLLSMDAKFSIDTAKSPQVSAEVLRALLEVGPAITDHLGQLDIEAAVRDGYFLSPDVALTHYVLQLGRGRLASRVPGSSVTLLTTSPVSFLKPMKGARLLGTLATLDGFRQEIRTNMLLAMYYFRLVRACYGAWIETITPLVGRYEVTSTDDSELESQVIEIARSSQNSWQVVMTWDARAEYVKRQREAVSGAMALPMRSAELRERIEAESALRGVDAPSINSVRRAIGGWYRRQFDEMLGVIPGPVEDIGVVLTQVHEAARAIAPRLPDAFNQVIEEAFSNLSDE